MADQTPDTPKKEAAPLPRPARAPETSEKPFRFTDWAAI